jgi:hypothetical protein
MWTWLSSPPALIIGVLASILGIGQFLRPLTRKIILFPHCRAERQLGHALAPIIQALVTGKGTPPPKGQDWSMYKA